MIDCWFVEIPCDLSRFCVSQPARNKGRLKVSLPRICRTNVAWLLVFMNMYCFSGGIVCLFLFFWGFLSRSLCSSLSVGIYLSGNSGFSLNLCNLNRKLINTNYSLIFETFLRSIWFYQTRCCYECKNGSNPSWGCSNLSRFRSD